MKIVVQDRRRVIKESDADASGDTGRSCRWTGILESGGKAWMSFQRWQKNLYLSGSIKKKQNARLMFRMLSNPKSFVSDQMQQDL